MSTLDTGLLFKLLEDRNLRIAMNSDQSIEDSEIHFLPNLLQIVVENENEPQPVYIFLLSNLEKLNEGLIEILPGWCTAILPKVGKSHAFAISVALVNLGNLLRSFPYGNRVINLEIAISSCESALTILTRDAFPDYWATTQNILGVIYRLRLRGDRAQNIEHSLQCFQYALQVHTQADFPMRWAEVHNGLGNAYNDRIRGDRANNIEQAITSFQFALQVRTREALPTNWATTQNNLGIAYYSRLKGKRLENLEMAIACYKSALQVRTQLEMPVQWAESLNNLANAYSARIKGDRAENMEQALAALYSILQVYTPGDFPQDWAMTQNNLGETYRDRVMGDQSENFNSAIAAYESALRVYTPERFPVQWATIQNNLGIAYYSQVSDPSAESLELAIASFEKALQVRTKEDLPQQWAETQNNLGNAYSDRTRGDHSQNLAKAVIAYRAALQVHTRKTFPSEWAKTQNNLALAYRDSRKLVDAIDCFQAALEIYTPTAFPFECLIAGRNLGKSAYAISDWSQSLVGFDIAIHAAEQSRAWASTDDRRQQVLSAAIDVYNGAVEACLAGGDTKQALEYVERSKARNLVDLLAKRDLLPNENVPPSVVKQLKLLRHEIRTEQRQLDIADRAQHSGRSFGIENSIDGWFADRTCLNQLSRRLESLVAQEIRPHDAVFSLTQSIEPIDFDRIQALLPNEKTALIEWFITEEKFFAFIVDTHHLAPQVWQASVEDRHALEQWIIHYLTAYSQEKQQWQLELDQQLSQLSDILHIDKLIDLLPDGCDQLILIPHRFLHIIPLQGLPLSKGRCLLDQFSEGVCYAPSAQLMEKTQCLDRLPLRALSLFQNPSENIAYADWESAALCSLFSDPRVFDSKADMKTMLAEPNQLLSEGQCIHFACHGYFNLDSPLESSLALAKTGTDRSLEDIHLKLVEIFDLDLRQYRLATLSACETGLTDFTSLSDEYVGFPSGFFVCGYVECGVFALGRERFAYGISDVSLLPNTAPW